MRILLDTNIIIHREASKIYNEDIGTLFNWLDKLHYTKCVHPLTEAELNRNINQDTARTMQIKLTNYHILKTEAPLNQQVKTVSDLIDTVHNDFDDTKLINEVFCDRVDFLISEDKKIHKKAVLLGIADRVFKIETFLEKITAENPDFVDYKVLAVKKEYFGSINIGVSFFDSFREDYIGFDKWFNKKSDEIAYVCHHNNVLSAFLFIKIEDETEDYSNITPSFEKKKRLKIGTFKVTSNGFKLGERFLKIIFDNALQYKVDEIYVTLFNKREEQKRLIDLLEEWGFKQFGIKSTASGQELVFIRPFGKSIPINIENPKYSFPFFSRNTRKYIIKIEHQYHTELFPDSINMREAPMDYVENMPHRNALSKVYISHSQDRYLKSGDVIVIYRMGETSPKKYSSTVTTICIVENIVDNIKSADELISLCRKRTVISDEDLKTKFWDKFAKLKPFVINFLYAHSFPTPKPTLNDLNQLGIIPDIMNIPRGFIEITNEQFTNLLKFIYNK